jgi:hypothetical protein
MLNWERVSNLLCNVNHYQRYALIDEIIVFNNNRKYDLRKIGNNKLTLIESTKDLGLYSRFAAAGLARNSCIMHCDDDVFIYESTVNRLYTYWLKNPLICHGLQGRIVGDCYNPQDAFGNVHIVLTKCMLVSKSNCLSAFLFSLNFSDIPGEPVGNGEDIILSYVSMYNARRYNMVYRLPYYSYPEHSSISIHQRWKHHFEHRTKVLRRCQKLLGMSNVPFRDSSRVLRRTCPFPPLFMQHDSIEQLDVPDRSVRTRRKVAANHKSARLAEHKQG